MIKTQIQTVWPLIGEEAIDIKKEMPHPVQVGDEIEWDETGRNVTVETVTWIIMEDGSVELLVRVR